MIRFVKADWSRIGDNVKIGAGVVLGDHACIGRGAIIEDGLVLDSHLLVSSGVRLSHGHVFDNYDLVTKEGVIPGGALFKIRELDHGDSLVETKIGVFVIPCRAICYTNPDHFDSAIHDFVREGLIGNDPHLGYYLHEAQSADPIDRFDASLC